MGKNGKEVLKIAAAVVVGMVVYDKFVKDQVAKIMG